MRFLRLMKNKQDDLWHAPAVCIACLGDSVTQGCFEDYKLNNSQIQTVFNQHEAYHAHLHRLLSDLYPSVPVHIINSGISGDHACHGYERLEQDVLRYAPDLVVICYGLNDCSGKEEGLAPFMEALRQIVTTLQAKDIEVLGMTPNMMATEASCHLKDPDIIQAISHTVALQNEGWLDRYVEASKQVYTELGVSVVDVYAKWQALARQGVDTTSLLSNYGNHPRPEMNRWFAEAILDKLMEV